MEYSEIGLIVDTPATYDDEGNELTAATYVDRWHVNTLEPVEDWDAYRIPTPETPVRVYAGGIMPVCYAFPDQETFTATIGQGEDNGSDI